MRPASHNPRNAPLGEPFFWEEGLCWQISVTANLQASAGGVMFPDKTISVASTAVSPYLALAVTCTSSEGFPSALG